MVKEVGEDEPFTPDNIMGDLLAEIIDQETGEIIDFEQYNEIREEIKPTIITGGEITTEKQSKVYIAGVDVTILNERLQYLNEDGDLVTTNLRDYTRQNLRQQFSSLDEFLTRWHEADKKSALIAQLREQDIIMDDLQEDIKQELDLFDFICYIGWDCQILIRKERAENVRKGDYFTRYDQPARVVLEALLEKYVKDGIENIEDLSVLKLEPLKRFGHPLEIVKRFGGKAQYIAALQELKTELYQGK